jgi:hypothetical protein
MNNKYTICRRIYRDVYFSSDWFGDVTRFGSIPVLSYAAQTVESFTVTAQIGTSPDYSILVTTNISHKILDSRARQELKCEKGRKIAESILFTILAREGSRDTGSVTYTTKVQNYPLRQLPLFRFMRIILGQGVLSPPIENRLRKVKLARTSTQKPLPIICERLHAKQGSATSQKVTL